MSAAPSLPPFWTIERDWRLYTTIFEDGQWANAIFKAASKMASQSLQIEGDVPLRVRKAREMLMAFDLERGWVSGISKQLQAFLLTGNGSFVEIVHQTGAAGSKVLGLVHLDTFRCTRTGDPQFPVIYRDVKGGEHVMKAHQVFMLSDMPDQADRWYGVGHCAAERAFLTIQKQVAIERFIFEKTTGKRPLAIHIVNGPTEMQLQNAVTLAKEDSLSKGMATYMGAAIMTMVDPTSTPGVATIPLASLPDGFDSKVERSNAYLVYANAIGIDPQMLDPELLSGRALGSGAQSRVVAEKMEGVGLSAWRKGWEHNVNLHALDSRTTFSFQELDLDKEQREAAIAETHSRTLSAYVTMGAIAPEQAVQVAVDNDELPEEFLPSDETADTTLTDELKPTGEGSGLPLDDLLYQEESGLPLDELLAVSPEDDMLNRVLGVKAVLHGKRFKRVRLVQPKPRVPSAMERRARQLIRQETSAAEKLFRRARAKR
jgi:hypothetical protein